MFKLKRYLHVLFFMCVMPMVIFGIVVSQMIFLDTQSDAPYCIECVPISMRNVYVLEDRIVIAGGIKPEIGGGLMASTLYGMTGNTTTMDEAAVIMHLLSGNDIIHPVMTGAPINFTVTEFKLNSTQNLDIIENLTRNFIEMRNETALLGLIRDFPIMEKPLNNATKQILEYCPKWSVLSVNADGLIDDGMYTADVFCENQTKSFTTFLLENNFVTPNYTMCGTSKFTAKYCP